MMTPGLRSKLPVLYRTVRGNIASGLAVGALVAAGAGCGPTQAFQGPTLQVSGDWNAWSTSDATAVLTWDGERYSGVVALPGDQLSLRLFAPTTGQLVGRAVGGAAAMSGQTAAAASPGAAPVPSTVATSLARTVEPFQIATPLPTRYHLDFTPASGQLHIDLADDAETTLGDDAAAKALVVALRGADQLAMAERRERAEALRRAMQAVETPLHVGKAETSGLVFLHLLPVDFPELSVVGDFNSWTAGHDNMQVVLDGTVAYLGRRASGVRVEYRFDLHGLRYTDPLNLEVAWDGTSLPPNPDNLLGGGLGEWNSVGFAPGYEESAPRLRRVPQLLPPVATEGSRALEVFVSLPAGYGQNPQQRYPTVYFYDGKDALIRGHYDFSLKRLAAAKQIPNVIGVFVSSPPTPAARLGMYSNFPDTQYPEIMPTGDDTAKQLLGGVVPRIDALYRTAAPHALLGIDIAAPHGFYLAWTDPSHYFTRLASQSGRFGWGDATLVNSQYIQKLGVDQSKFMERLSLDYSDSDSVQAQTLVHDAVKAALGGTGYLGKVQITHQGVQTGPLWDALRGRLDNSLIFLLRDLVK